MNLRQTADYLLVTRAEARTARYLVVCFLGLLHFLVVTGESLPETVRPESQCVGVGLSAACPTQEVVVVDSVRRGAKPTADSCPTSYTSYNSTCCSADADDCMIPVDSIDIYSDDCNGRATICTFTDNGVPSASHCNSSFVSPTNFVVLDYVCIANTRIEALCPRSSTSKTISDGTAFYIQNDFYPNPISKSDRSCNCSVETDSCDGGLVMYTAHMSLFEQSNNCKQTVAIDAGSTTTTFDCSSSTGYVVRKHTYTETYLTMVLQNSATADGGYVMVGFQASKQGASLHINCPAKGKSYCLSTTAQMATATSRSSQSQTSTTASGNVPSQAQTTAFGNGTSQTQTTASGNDNPSGSQSSVTQQVRTSTTTVRIVGGTESEPKDNDTGVIVGAVIGGIAVVAAIVIGTFIYYKNKQSKDRSKQSGISGTEKGCNGTVEGDKEQL